MLVLLSPAKKLNENHSVLGNATIPQFVDESELLINNLKKYSPKKLGALMSLSDALAELNVNRYHNWDKKHNVKTAKTAALIFDGEAYTGLNAVSLTTKQMSYAQDNLRILSGLYGILKPLDIIHPYRLEMSTKLKVGKKNNLYEFWGDKIVDEINKILQNQKQKTLVNLASNEYFKVVNTKKLKGDVITPVFKDFNNGKYKMVMVYAKKARGMMANYILTNKIEKIEDLKGFDVDGYCFNAAASKANELVFLRG
jgi:cytoplasmic iron level regulating protein YaaA (DUF328/UPF0246 family)